MKSESVGEEASKPVVAVFDGFSLVCRERFRISGPNPIRWRGGAYLVSTRGLYGQTRPQNRTCRSGTSGSPMARSECLSAKYDLRPDCNLGSPCPFVGHWSASRKPLEEPTRRTTRQSISVMLWSSRLSIMSAGAYDSLRKR